MKIIKQFRTSPVGTMYNSEDPEYYLVKKGGMTYYFLKLEERASPRRDLLYISVNGANIQRKGFLFKPRRIVRMKNE
jgi:hypothetical protein